MSKKQKKKPQNKEMQQEKNIWRILVPAIAVVCVCALIAGVYLLTDRAADGGEEQIESDSDPTDAVDTGKHHVEIEVENYGTIFVELDADAAPITVENFIKLANEGFYNGLTFHRIMEGFMMQGGDPNGDGTGGSPDNIKGEFSNNGVDNPLSHTRGAISMARSGNPYNPASAYNTASSQFFIVQQDALYLDGDYACFGYVTDGMDVVDAICADAQPTDNNGTIPAEEQPVITEIRVMD